MNTKDKRAAMLKKCSCSWDTNITLNATDSQIESGKIVHGIASFIWNDDTGCWNTPFKLKRRESKMKIRLVDTERFEEKICSLALIITGILSVIFIGECTFFIFSFCLGVGLFVD